jgi:uncharacterized protein YciI
MREQILWSEHAAFMKAHATEGFVVLGGPLGEGREVLLIIDAPDEASIRTRLAGDPWSAAGLLAIDRVEPWTVLLGGGST